MISVLPQLLFLAVSTLLGSFLRAIQPAGSSWREKQQGAPGEKVRTSWKVLIKVWREVSIPSFHFFTANVFFSHSANFSLDVPSFLNFISIFRAAYSLSIAIFMVSVSIPQSLFFFFIFTFLHPFFLPIYPFIILFPTALVAVIYFIRNISSRFLISLPIKWTSLIYCVIFSLIHYFIPHLLVICPHSLSIVRLILPITSFILCHFSPVFLRNSHVLFAVFSFCTFFPHNLEPRCLYI